MSNLWLYPTEVGKEDFHIKGPANVESGVRPFLVEKLGHRVYAEKIIDRTPDGIRIKWTDGAQIFARQGTGKVLIATVKNQPYGHTEPDAVKWGTQPRVRQGYGHGSSY